MRWKHATHKITRSIKLQGTQHSPGIVLRSMDLCAPENLFFAALECKNRLDKRTFHISLTHNRNSSQTKIYLCAKSPKNKLEVNRRAVANIYWKGFIWQMRLEPGNCLRREISGTPLAMEIFMGSFIKSFLKINQYETSVTSGIKMFQYFFIEMEETAFCGVAPLKWIHIYRKF